MSRGIARIYVAWQRWRRRTAQAWDAVQAGVWLGLLGRESLHAVDEAFYQGSASYRDDRHNLRGLFAWEDEAVRGFFGAGGSLLLVGAGGGREVLALWERGHRVTGYECNAALVAYAGELLRRRGCPASVTLLARDAAPPGEGIYDGAVVGWSAYMLVAGREHRIALLRALRRRVDTGAPLLLSFWTRPGEHRRSRIVRAAAAPIRALLRREPPEPGDDLVPNFVHRFTEAEVEAEMRAAGFRLARFQPEGEGPYDSGWAVGIAEGAS